MSSTTSFAPLSADVIRNELDVKTNNQLTDIYLHDSIPSSNDALWAHIENGGNSPAVCMTETQTAGRGRRGDHWYSPESGNIYLSISWVFPAESTQNGLSIAIGISLINCLKSEGINDLQLKWPNDILHKRHKLAGILVESRYGKQLSTVIGIGLNVKLPTAIKNKIQQPTTSLQQLCTSVPCRNKLAGKIIQTMINTLEHFQDSGLRDFAPHYPNYDALMNQDVTLTSNEGTQTVIARGINEQGELQYQVDDTILTLSNSHTGIRFAS